MNPDRGLLDNVQFPDRQLQQRRSILQLMIDGKLRIYGTKIHIQTLGGDGMYALKHAVNMEPPYPWWWVTNTFKNVTSDKKTMCTQALLVTTMIPPISHQHPGHIIFDLDAKHHRFQIRASKAIILDLSDSGRDVNAFDGPAQSKCMPPNLLQPIIENDSPHLRATHECLSLDLPNGMVHAWVVQKSCKRNILWVL